MALFLRQTLERVKHFLQPEPIDECVQEVTVNNIWMFSDLKQVIDKLNMICRSPFYETGPSSRLQRYNDILFRINIPLAFMELIFFTFFTKQNLLGFISTSFQLAGFLTASSFYINMLHFKQDYKILLNWIGVLPQRSCFIMKNTGLNLFYKARRGSLLAIKLSCLAFAFTAVSFLIIFPLLKYFVVGEPFALPFSINLPFVRPVNLQNYLINFVHQAYVTISAFIWALTWMCIVYTILIHAWTHLGAIKMLIENMTESVRAADFPNWLNCISNELSDATRNLKLLCHRILPLPFYVVEKMIYFGFIIFWLSKVEIRLFPWAVASGALLMFVLVFAILNEMLLDQFDDLSDLLYEQPWYELTPTERRLLLPTMIQLQRPVIITTGIQDVTLFWYSSIIKAAYSMALVMEEFIAA